MHALCSSTSNLLLCQYIYTAILYTLTGNMDWSGVWPPCACSCYMYMSTLHVQYIGSYTRTLTRTWTGVWTSCGLPSCSLRPIVRWRWRGRDAPPSDGRGRGQRNTTHHQPGGTWKQVRWRSLFRNKKLWLADVLRVEAYMYTQAFLPTCKQSMFVCGYDDCHALVIGNHNTADREIFH